MAGLAPARLTARVSKTRVSADFTTHRNGTTTEICTLTKCLEGTDATITSPSQKMVRHISAALISSVWKTDTLAVDVNDAKWCCLSRRLPPI